MSIDRKAAIYAEFVGLVHQVRQCEVRMESANREQDQLVSELGASRRKKPHPSEGSRLKTLDATIARLACDVDDLGRQLAASEFSMSLIAPPSVMRCASVLADATDPDEYQARLRDFSEACRADL